MAHTIDIISQIKILGQLYDICDEKAHAEIASIKDKIINGVIEVADATKIATPPVEDDMGKIFLINEDGAYNEYVALAQGEGDQKTYSWQKIGGNSIAKLSHSLTIGNQVYDGSKDVIVGTYDGEVITP